MCCVKLLFGSHHTSMCLLVRTLLSVLCNTACCVVVRFQADASGLICHKSTNHVYGRRCRLENRKVAFQSGVSRAGFFGPGSAPKRFSTDFATIYSRMCALISFTQMIFFTKTDVIVLVCRANCIRIFCVRTSGGQSHCVFWILIHLQ